MRRRDFARDDRGQAVVELALVGLPIILLLLFGMIEFGTAFHHNLTLSAAVREGARTGGALANGGGDLGCGSDQSPNAATVDPEVIAAVQRVLKGNRLVAIADVGEIRIWKSTAAGTAVANEVNIWTYSAGGGPVVGGEQLDFVASGTQGWDACERNNVSPADSIGVSLTYTYRSETPLGFLVPGLATLPMADRAVMPLNAAR